MRNKQKRITNRAIRALTRKEARQAGIRDAIARRRTTELLRGSERLGDREGLPYDRR